MIYKRGKIYWFNFVFNGQHIQKSTHQKNAQVARDAEAAERMRLVKGELGIERKAPRTYPTMEGFKETFMEWVKSEKDNERTREFYETCYQRLCDYKPLGKATLDKIDESLIEEFKLSVLEESTRTTCNRYLATLKKALRYAMRKRKLIDKMPVIELYPNERGREYVYSDADYQGWLKAAREPLRSASVLAHDGGICRGELLALKKDCVHLASKPDSFGFWGKLEIRRGLKRDARRRDIPITENMAAALQNVLAESKCEYVFTSLQDRSQPLSANTLADQHRAIIGTCSFDPDAGLHALRHTFLTEAGRHTQNVRALQRLAGHARIETTMRYVHPDQEDVMAIAGAVQTARSLRESKEASGVTTVLTTSTSGLAVVARKQ